jgi:hypothetical protein
MSIGDVRKTDRSRLLLYIRLMLSYPDFKHAYRAAQYLLLDQHDAWKIDGDYTPKPKTEWSYGEKSVFEAGSAVTVRQSHLPGDRPEG